MLDKIITNRLTVRKTDEEINKILNPVVEASLDTEKVLVSAPTEQQETNPFDISPIQVNSIPTIEQSNIVQNSYSEEPVIIIDDMEQLPAINEDDIAVDPTVPTEQFKIDETIVNPNPLDLSVNMPTSPIEDVPAVVPTVETPVINNPGFMDIDKIENNAKDINVEKPDVDINSLLKPSIMGEEPKVELPSEEVKEEIPAPKEGRFFTLPDEEEKLEVQESAMPVATGLSDAFNFEVNLNSVEPTVPETTVPTDLTSLTTSAPEALDNLLQQKEELPVINEDIVAAPVQEEPTAPIENNTTASETIDSLFNFNESPVSSPVAMSVLNSESPVETLDVTTNPETIDVAESNIAPIATEDLSNNLINPNFDLNIAAPIERSEVYSEPISSEDMPVPSNESVQTINKNINEALNIVRENVKTLEGMGYVIDTEEFDFESAYQIVIKITK